MKPRCDTCRRPLAWERPSVARVPRTLNVTVRRKRFSERYRKMRRNEAKLAIRCVDCLRVFCPRCARKHFIPAFRVQARVMRAVDRVVERSLRGVRCVS